MPPGGSWGLLGPPGPPWASWAPLGPPEASWGLLGLPGASWGLLGPPGASWGLLGAPGASWAPLGLIGPPVRTRKHFCCVFTAFYTISGPGAREISTIWPLRTRKLEDAGGGSWDRLCFCLLRLLKVRLAAAPGTICVKSAWASWGLLRLPGASWGLLRAPGASWAPLGLLGPPGASWGLPGLPGASWWGCWRAPAFIWLGREGIWALLACSGLLLARQG